MKLLKTVLCLAALLALAGPPHAVANNAGAVVLVNSQSAKYADFQHFLRPYLTNFGVPFDLLDIASNSVGANLTNYALIIVGHAQLDPNHLYLNAAAQSSLSLAVSNGAGLVSFDNVLATNNTPIYQYEQDIFGLGYTTSTTSGTVVFPPTEPASKMHYITSLHAANETLAFAFVTDTSTNPTTMTVSGVTLPAGATAVATCGGKPFVVIAKYGQGRAVQWTSYDWMSSTIQGPLNGLDDLVWRGFTWAARKPFVMRGFPHFATVRIDDVTGNEATSGSQPPAFWWVHSLTNAGFKPWLGLFIDDLTYESQTYPGDHRLLDLSNLVASGSVTASVHSFSATATGSVNFFYFNHATESPYSDSVMANNYVRGTQFLQANGITSSSMIIAHYSEMGANSFSGLTNWGVQFVMIEVVPGTVEYASPGAPWLVGGPFRLFETPQPGKVNMPMLYADWLAVPGHPELNGKFFNPYTEIRNVDQNGEWAPGVGTVADSINRGYKMIKRGFDSMTLGNMFTHEFYIDPSDGPALGNISTNNFAAMLTGITNALAPYNPVYVTMDYGCQYLRATRTAQITSADYNPVTGQITAAFSGYSDIPITAYYYTGADSSITNIPATVPVFTGTTNVNLVAGQAVLLVSADPRSRSYGTTNPVLTYTITGFTGTDTVAVVSGSAGLSTSAATNSPVGNYSIVVTNINLSASNYSFTFNNGNLTVGKAPLLVASDSQNRVYGATNPPLTWSVSGLLGIDTVSVLSGTPSLSTAATTNSPVGNYPIAIATGSLVATNYNFNFATNPLAVSPATLLVSADPKSRLYGATNPLLSYSLSGFSNSETAAVVAGTAGLSTPASSNSPVGTYPITVTNLNLSATNYNFAFSNGLLSIDRALLLVSADAKSRTYGAVNPVLSYTISGFAGTDTPAVVTGSAGLSTLAVTNSQVGSYAIAVTNINLGATNYNFNFSNNWLTVTSATLLINADPKNRLYGAANPALTYSVSGFAGTDTVAVLSGNPALSTTATTNSPVGGYPITVTNGNLSATNYGFTFITNVMTVNPASLLVRAGDQGRLYGATNPLLTYTVSGFAGTDTVAVVTGGAGLSTVAGTNSPVGMYSIVVTNRDLSASNYHFDFSNGVFSVGRALLLVSADAKSRAYGTANPALTYTVSGFMGADTLAVVTGGAGVSTLAGTNTPVGTYAIAVTNINLAATNYNFSFSNSLLTVTPAALQVSANPQNRLYGAPNPALTYSVSGFAGTDTVAVLSGNPALNTAATTTSPVGVYSISITNGNLSATNYGFTFKTNVLTVNPASLLVHADDQGRSYGTTNPLFTYTVSGFAGTDTMAVVAGNAALSTLADTNSPVGTYSIVVTNLDLSATNYSFNFSNGTLSVGRAILLVSADAKSRTYGATNPSLTYAVSGFVNTDTSTVVTGSAGLGTLADARSAVGAYAITVTNINLAATNYSFNFSNNWLSINPATLLVSANNLSRPYGATNPALTYTVSGFLGTDTVTTVTGIPALVTTADGASAVGPYPVTVTNGNLTATNYGFTFSNGTLRVTALPPVILSITGFDTTNVLITWSALSNATYRVCYADDFQGTNWEVLSPDVTATNTTASMLDNPGGALTRFYRVMVP